jgi:hypothetical protein
MNTYSLGTDPLEPEYRDTEALPLVSPDQVGSNAARIIIAFQELGGVEEAIHAAGESVGKALRSAVESARDFAEDKFGDKLLAALGVPDLSQNTRDIAGSLQAQQYPEPAPHARRAPPPSGSVVGTRKKSSTGFRGRCGIMGS